MILVIPKTEKVSPVHSIAIFVNAHVKKKLDKSVLSMNSLSTTDSYSVSLLLSVLMLRTVDTNERKRKYVTGVKYWKESGNMKWIDTAAKE